MSKPVGASQRKPKKWINTKSGRDPNYALATFRKVKRAERAKKVADQSEYDSLCSEVVVTKIEPTMSHLLEDRLARQGRRANKTNPRSLGTNPRAKQISSK